MMSYDGAEAQFQLFLTLTYEYEWSASHQNRCTPSPPHQTEDPPVTPQQLAHRAALTASQWQTACRMSNRYCLVVNIYIYGFWHNYMAGSLLAIVFTALVFYNLFISVCKINCPHISPYLQWCKFNSRPSVSSGSTSLTADTSTKWQRYYCKIR